MAAKNGSVWTIISLFGLVMGCLLLAVAFLILASNSNPIQLDMGYHQQTMCFHDHRI